MFIIRVHGRDTPIYPVYGSEEGGITESNFLPRLTKNMTSRLILGRHGMCERRLVTISYGCLLTPRLRPASCREMTL